MPERKQDLLTGDEFADLMRIFEGFREDLDAVRAQVDSITVIIENSANGGGL